VRIEILHVADCPNLETARQRLEAALDRTDVTANVEVFEVTSTHEAQRRSMRGSPTILVDGQDPFASSSDEASLSCRLFATDDGVDGAPSVDQLIAALTPPACCDGGLLGDGLDETARGLARAGFAALW
jgi:hypothetical protein